MLFNGTMDGYTQKRQQAYSMSYITPNKYDSPLTTDSENRKPKVATLLGQEEPNYYLLIKNLPENTSEEDIKQIFEQCSSLEKIVVIPKINNVYVKFGDLAEIRILVEQQDVTPLVFNGTKLRLCFVNKLPLDLNDKSRVLLITVYEEKIELTAHGIYDMFKDTAHICKIVIFKKKNYQVFIEFKNCSDAAFFKEAYDNTNYKGYFFLKIQFTKKDTLNVKPFPLRDRF